MKLLVTGATGFLGSKLVKQFLADGHDIVILKRSFSNIYRIKEVIDHIQSYDIDQCGLEQPFRDNDRFDAVIHTATSYGRKEESVQEVFKSNTEFPLQLLEIATFFNTNTFFNTDTILYKNLNNYALSKSQFVEWGKMFASWEKIRFINIKLEHMYGPKDNETKFATFVIRSCLANVPDMRLTLGEQKRDFIYIDDVVSAYQVLLDKTGKLLDYFQEYELGTGDPISIKMFVETVHAITQSQTRLNFGVLPYRENEIMKSCADIEKMRELGWKPVIQLSDGINKIIQEEKQSCRRS